MAKLTRTEIETVFNSLSEKKGSFPTVDELSDGLKALYNKSINRNQLNTIKRELENAATKLVIAVPTPALSELNTLLLKMLNSEIEVHLAANTQLIESLNADVASSSAMIDGLQADIESLKAQLNASISDQLKMEGSVRAKDEELIELKSKVTALLTELSDTRAAGISKAAEVDVLNTRIRELQDKLDLRDKELERFNADKDAAVIVAKADKDKEIDRLTKLFESMSKGPV
jgi:hypothetical protein